MRARIRFDVDGTEDMVLKAPQISSQLKYDKRTKLPMGIFKLKNKRGKKIHTVRLARVWLVDIDRRRKK